MIVALSLGVTAFVQAQTEKKDQHRRKLSTEQIAERQTARMAESLKLSGDQKQELLKLNTESASAAKELNKEYREKRRAQRDAREGKLKCILTSEQYEAYQAQKAERKKKRMERRAAMKSRKGGQGSGHSLHQRRRADK